MKQRNFVATALAAQNQTQTDTVQSRRTLNLFGAINSLYNLYTEWSERRNRVRICKHAAELFCTDMESAGTLLFLFRGKTLWIDGDPYKEREQLFAYLAGQTAQIEQDESPVHPAWPQAALAASAPMIEDYPDDAFAPEAHEVNQLVQRLSLHEVEQPKFAKPKTPRFDATTMAAMEVLTEFTLKLYESLEGDEPLLKQDGTLLKGVSAPWSQRGVDGKGNEVTEPVKRRIRELIGATGLFVLGESKLWRLDLFTFSDFDTACAAVESAAKT